MTDEYNHINDTVTPDDIPEVPGWEQAFQQYASQQAPDLMPRILAKIQAETKPAEPVPAESIRQAEEPGPIKVTKQTGERKPGAVSRFLRVVADNQKRILTLSGVAAAVIILGFFVIMASHLGKTKDSSERPYNNNAAAPTATAPVDSEFSPGGTEACDDDPKHGKRDSQSGKNEDTPADERSDDSVAHEALSLDDNLSLQSKSFLKPESEYVLDNVSLAATVPAESPVGDVPAENSAYADLMGDSETVYHVLRDGRATNLLVLWADDASGQVFMKLTLSYIKTVTVDGEKFELFRVVSGTK